jgi:hypothetical protein
MRRYWCDIDLTELCEADRNVHVRTYHEVRSWSLESVSALSPIFQNVETPIYRSSTIIFLLTLGILSSGLSPSTTMHSRLISISSSAQTLPATASCPVHLLRTSIANTHTSSALILPPAVWPERPCRCSYHRVAYCVQYSFRCVYRILYRILYRLCVQLAGGQCMNLYARGGKTVGCGCSFVSIRRYSV